MSRKTQWKYLDGHFVTGHLSHKGLFVDVRPGNTAFFQDVEGKVWVKLIPAKGMVTPEITLPTRIVNVNPYSWGNVRVVDVEVHFDGKTIPLNVGHKLFTIPEAERVTYVISSKKVTGYLVGILFTFVMYAILRIHLSTFSIVGGILIFTILYVATLGFKEKKVLYTVKTDKG